MIVRCEHCGTKNRVPSAADGGPVCGNCHRPLPWIADAGEEDFTEVAERSSVPVIVDLWATWCAPCRTVSPVLERIAHEMAGRLKVVKIDIDRAPKIQERFAVRAVPTLLLMRDGKLIDRRAGALPPGPLRTWVREAIERDT
ncbi:thioredoxin [Actinomadura macra]|uniref:thioredoxin n=1 Tax=Actinomadura macra TaxID=46164 RepID=UPI00082E34E2|nr:thioredoxin [Actinomadura macra]